MKDKAFDLLAIRITDTQTRKRIFNNDMFVAINGKRKEEISSEQGYQAYRKRYDIEPFFRFAKQRLFLQDFQTSDEQHFDNWLLINQLSTWLLYHASDEAHYIPTPWRQYQAENQNLDQAPRLSIAQTYKAAQNLFLTFDKEPFLSKESKKGRPRRKGESQTPKPRYKVVKKSTHKTKIKLKNEKIE